jgi:hypothetical protein
MDVAAVATARDDRFLNGLVLSSLTVPRDTYPPHSNK